MIYLTVVKKHFSTEVQQEKKCLPSFTEIIFARPSRKIVDISKLQP